MINKIAIQKEIITCNHCMKDCEANEYNYLNVNITGDMQFTKPYYSSRNNEVHLCRECYNVFKRDCEKAITEFIDSLVNNWLYNVSER